MEPGWWGTQPQRSIIGGIPRETPVLASGLVTWPGLLPGFHRPIAPPPLPRAPNQTQTSAKPPRNQPLTTPKLSPNRPTISKQFQNQTETIPKAPQDPFTIPDPVIRLHGFACRVRFGLQKLILIAKIISFE